MLQADRFTGEHMQTEQLTWHYEGTTIELGADWSGQGPLVLLLPALSSISTRKRLVLIAPTWRGPLPTMMDGQWPLFDRICQLVDLPVIGPLLYRLNV